MHEIWIGTKNYQTTTIVCVDHNLPTPQERHQKQRNKNNETRKGTNEQKNKNNKTNTKEKTSKNSEPGGVLTSKIIRTMKP